LKKKSEVYVGPKYPRVFETFREMSSYEISNITEDKPTCFNGYVSVRKYKITIELIDEPVEIIQDRIKELYNKSTNHHDWQPLQNEAKKYGMDRLTHD
jgi:hypothetical protein